MARDPRFLRIVIVGDHSVGKRSLIRQFGAPYRKSNLYIPIEFTDIKIKGDKKQWEVHCFDSLIAPYEVPKNIKNTVSSLNGQVLSDSNAVIYLYQIDNPDSVKNLNAWQNEIAMYLPQWANTYLVGVNKKKSNKVEDEVDELKKKMNFKRELELDQDDQGDVKDFFEKVVEDIEESIEKFQEAMKNPSPVRMRTEQREDDMRPSVTGKKITVNIDEKTQVVITDGSYRKMPDMLYAMATSMKEQNVRIDKRDADDTVLCDEQDFLEVEKGFEEALQAKG